MRFTAFDATFYLLEIVNHFLAIEHAAGKKHMMRFLLAVDDDQNRGIGLRRDRPGSTKAKGIWPDLP